MLSLLFAVLFGLSLLPGRKPLCFSFAEKISDGIVPDGAWEYCRKLTWVWFFILLGNCALMAFVRVPGAWYWQVAASSAISLLVVSGTFAVEGWFRRRRFAVVFHTSGSTAQPKKIVKPFETLAREVAYHRTVLRAEIAARTGTDAARLTFLSTVDHEHMYGQLWRVMLPRAWGCAVDEEVILTPESLLAKMRAAERVFLVTTPSFLDRFTAYAAQYEVPQNCVEITTSGALLTAAVAQRTEQVFGLAPREIFGSTETGGVAWRRQSARSRPASDYDWEVFAPVQVKVRDGRLAVRSPFSCPRSFGLGDAVEMAPDGRHFKLLGRRDRLVKINEQRVSLPEMETRMADLPGVREAALVKLGGEHGDYLGAVVVPEPGGEFDFDRADPAAAERKRRAALALRQRLLPVFPRGTVPKKYRFVAELPRNHQGKLAVRDLLTLFD